MSLHGQTLLSPIAAPYIPADPASFSALRCQEGAWLYTLSSRDGCLTCHVPDLCPLALQGRFFQLHQGQPMLEELGGGI